MQIGYFALTEMTAEKEMVIYYGNVASPELVTVNGRFKVHLLPVDIKHITIVAKDFIDGTQETEAIMSVVKALSSGFIKNIITDEKTLNLEDAIMTASIKPKKKPKKRLDKS